MPTDSLGHSIALLSWANLTRAGRLRRSRHLAEAALARYDLPGAHLRFLREGDNLLYRVTTPDNGRFLLRVQELQRRTADELNSELLRLSALHRDGRLVAPGPRPTRTGALFAEVSADGIP